MRRKDRGDAELVSVPAATQCFGNTQSYVLSFFRSLALFLPFLAALGFLLGALWRFRCHTCSALLWLALWELSWTLCPGRMRWFFNPHSTRKPRNGMESSEIVVGMSSALTSTS